MDILVVGDGQVEISLVASLAVGLVLGCDLARSYVEGVSSF
jgi:hypothetical protein